MCFYFFSKYQTQDGHDFFGGGLRVHMFDNFPIHYLMKFYRLVTFGIFFQPV